MGQRPRDIAGTSGAGESDRIGNARHRRQRNHAPGLTDADRALLRRLTTGDLEADFKAALDALVAADPLADLLGS